MANTHCQTGATPAPKSLVSRVHRHHHGAPRDLRVGRRAPEVVRDAGADRGRSWPAHRGFPPDKGRAGSVARCGHEQSILGPGQRQQIQGMERMAPFVGYITVVYMLVFVPIFMVIISGHPVRGLQRRAWAGTRRSSRSSRWSSTPGPIGVLVAAVHRAAQLLSRHDDERDDARRCCCRCCLRSRSRRGCSG